MTPENIRHMAAGQISAALLVANAGLAEAAQVILRDVAAYLDEPTVKAPQHLKDVLAAAIADPVGKVEDLHGLERIFTDSLNTVIESGRGGFGN